MLLSLQMIARVSPKLATWHHLFPCTLRTRTRQQVLPVSEELMAYISLSIRLQMVMNSCCILLLCFSYSSLKICLRPLLPAEGNCSNTRTPQPRHAHPISQTTQHPLQQSHPRPHNLHNPTLTVLHIRPMRSVLVLPIRVLPDTGCVLHMDLRDSHRLYINEDCKNKKP